MFPLSSAFQKELSSACGETESEYTAMKACSAWCVF